MKKFIVPLLLMLLVFNSCDNVGKKFAENSDVKLQDTYGIMTQPCLNAYYKHVGVSDINIVMPLESLGQYFGVDRKSTGEFFLGFGSWRSEETDIQTFDLLVRFPKGTKIVKVPYKLVLINYDENHPRVSIPYYTLTHLDELLKRFKNGNVNDDPITVWVPRNSIFSDKAENNVYYKSFKK